MREGTGCHGQGTLDKRAPAATRCAVGATLAFGIAQGMGLDYPIFALVAAVIATDLTPAQCASSDCAGSSRRSSARCDRDFGA